eukprot:TRINITY_DN1584_c0_g1_i1.p1 TRINITY_DN1584_c0_g1~~TRINITY_DN1584_c0_g1_i1.p1  ORF type:complete len:1169 (-),score=237.78 TRINITY_DN1584_c0_g1_i1:433-3939(-)
MDDISVIIAAIRKEYSQNAPPNERAEARKFCQEFKDNPRASWFAFHLIHRDNEPTVRHFGLHLLEHTVKEKWNQIHTAKRASITKALLDFMKAGTKDILEEQAFIKQKVASILVEIAKNDWLVSWKTLDTDLQEIAMLGTSQIELVIIVYKILSEEIHSFENGIPKNRLKKLVEAMEELQGSILKFFYQVMERAYTGYKKSEIPHEKKINIKILTITLEALKSFVEWGPFDVLASAQLWPVLVLLMNEIPYRIVACECLMLVLSRSEKGQDEYKLLFLFDYLPQVVASIQNSTRDSTWNFEDNYLFEKRVVQLLVLLGTKHLTVYDRRREIPSSFQSYLEVMLQSTRHPSQMISSFTIPYWVSLLKNQELSQMTFIPELCQFICTSLDGKTIKIGRIDDDYDSSKKEDPEYKKFCKNHPSSPYNYHDFDDDADYVYFFSQYISKVTQLKQLIAKTAPIVLLQHTANKVERVIAMMHQFSSSANPAEPKTVSFKIASIEFEDLCNEIKTVVGNYGIPLSYYNTTDPSSIGSTTQNAADTPDKVNQILTRNKQIVEKIQSILQGIFYYHSPEPSIQHQLLEVLTSFGFYYKTNSSSVEYILTRVLELLTYATPQEIEAMNASNGQSPQLSKESIQIRRRAGLALVNLATMMNQHLLPYLGKLVEIVQGLISSNKLLLSEQTLLFQSLIAISNGMKNFDSQSGFIGQLVSFLETEWCDKGVTQLLSHFPTFISLMGIDNNPNYTQEQSSKREKFYGIIHCLATIWKQCEVPETLEERKKTGYDASDGNVYAVNNIRFTLRHPLSEHDLKVLPNVFYLVKAIHQLTSPEYLSSLTPENRILVTGENKEPKGDQVVEFRKGHNKVDNMREFAYEIISQSTIHGAGFYSIPNISQLLLENIFSNVNNCLTKHIIPLINKVVVPILTNIPKHFYYSNSSSQQQNYQMLLDSLIMPMNQAIIMIAMKISNNWDALTKSKAATSSGLKDKKELLAEVTEENMIREATRSYASMIHKIFIVYKMGTSGPFEIGFTPLFYYYLKHQESLFASLLPTMTFMMKMGDSSTLTKFVNIFSMFLPKLLPSVDDLVNKGKSEKITQLPSPLIKSNACVRVLGEELTTVLIQNILMNPQHENIHISAINLISLSLHRFSIHDIDVVSKVIAQLPNATSMNYHVCH